VCTGLAASAALSLNPYASVHFLLGAAGSCAFYLGARRWAAGRERFWIGWLVSAGAGVAAWACWQAAGGMESTLEAARASGMSLPDLWEARLRSGRPFGTLLLPAALGGLMAMTAPAAWGLAAERRGASRLAAALAGVLFLGVLGLSRSYGALAGATAAALWGAGRLPRRRAWAVRLAIVAAAAGAAFAFAGLRRSSSGQDFFSEEGPLVQRRLNWATAAAVAARHPVLGCGPGAYASAFVAARRPAENDTRYAHSTPLQAAAEAGVWALLPLGFAAARLRPRLRRARQGSGLQFGAAAGLVAFGVQNLVDFTAYLPSTLHAALALGAILPRAGGEGEGRGAGAARAAGRGGRPEGGGAAARRGAALLRWGLALACAASLPAFWSFWRGEELRQRAASAWRSGSVSEAGPLYAMAVQADPGRPELRLERALHLASSGQGSAAEMLDEALRAAAGDRGLASAWVAVSRAWQRQGEWAEAYLAAGRARSVHPADDRAREWLQALEAALSRAGGPGSGEP
jgi:hypothetical protein